MTEITSTSKWLGRLARYGPLLLWIGVIFYFSSSFGSFNRTSRFIGPLLQYLFPDASPDLIAMYHGYVRKLGHFSGYGILGFLASRAFSLSSVSALLNFWYLFAALLVLTVGSLDEFNQSFSSQRTALPSDVMIDLAGGLTAIFFFWLLIQRRRRSFPNEVGDQD